MTDGIQKIERPEFPGTKPGDSDPSANLGSEPVRRRGPGRPRKDGSSNAPVSPSATPIPQGSDKPRAKPGRKPKKVAISDAEKTALGKQIIGLHMIAAMTFGIPELVIQEPEGELLASAIVNVAEEYGLSLGGKTGAAIQLAGTAAMIYLPRWFKMQERVKQQRNTTIPETTQDTPINGTPAPTVN